jgi:hypothetical protein
MTVQGARPGKRPTTYSPGPPTLARSRSSSLEEAAGRSDHDEVRDRLSYPDVYPIVAGPVF